MSSVRSRHGVSFHSVVVITLTLITNYRYPTTRVRISLEAFYFCLGNPVLRTLSQTLTKAKGFFCHIGIRNKSATLSPIHMRHKPRAFSMIGFCLFGSVLPHPICHCSNEFVMVALSTPAALKDSLA